MAEQKSASATRWAILIGINFYGTRVKGLKGAVADVQDMEQYLRSRGIEQIEILTSSANLDPTSTLPKETASQWPTFENITATLEKVLRMSKRGDSLYIHFSGHGTQTQASSQHSRKETGDLALVLYHKDHGVRYMRGTELVQWFDQVVAHGLLMTVVLDCCFSGSVVRHDELSSVRTVRYDLAVGSLFPPVPGSKPSASRNIQSVPTWLIDPEGYNIFAACSPHELAHEMRLGPRAIEWKGALSHFLLRALKSSCPTEITTQSLYNHTRLKFHQFWPRQTPMQFGRALTSFFGTLGRVHNTEVVTALLKGRELCLDAGLAHGICKEDEYALYPRFSADSDSSYTGSPSFYARVCVVRELTSTLIEATGRDWGFISESRWQAKRVSLSTWKLRVRLNCHDRPLAQWMEVASRKRFLHLLGDDERETPFMFSLSLNDGDRYEIFDVSCHSNKLLPTVARNADGSIEKVCNMLEHLAIFKNVASIENLTPRQSFEESFAIQLVDESGNHYLPGEFVPIHAGASFILLVENYSDSPLFFEVFDMDPLWQITRVLSGGGEEFRVVAPVKREDDRPEHTGRLEIPFRASVPDELRALDETKCEDIFKVFLTSQATSFAALEAQTLVASRDDRGKTRRGEIDQDDLTAFLRDFARPFRTSNTCERVENWTTRTFVISTTELM